MVLSCKIKEYHTGTGAFQGNFNRRKGIIRTRWGMNSILRLEEEHERKRRFEAAHVRRKQWWERRLV